MKAFSGLQTAASLLGPYVKSRVGGGQREREGKKGREGEGGSSLSLSL